MHTEVHHEGVVAIVAVSGDVDASTAPELRETLDRLLDGGAQNFVIDLEEVGFMDSSGIAAFVQLFKRVRVGRGDVRLACLNTDVERVFRLIRLDRMFDTYARRADAVASYSGG